MKIILAIVGYFAGTLIGIILLAMFEAATESGAMKNTFLVANISGIICAIIGYNIPKKKS